MTQEEKELLIKDLCARLRSGLICSIYREDNEGFGWRDAECKGYFQNNDSYEFYFEDVITVDNIERLKPYLRPLSSMTEEERDELSDYLCEQVMSNKIGITIPPNPTQGKGIPFIWMGDCLDWLNKKMFDYRGLIPMGLAIEAPEGMYN